MIKKTKKNEPKYFRTLCQIDREAFGNSEDSGMIIKTFWRSDVNKIIVARKSDTQAIVGYAAFLIQDPPKHIMQKQFGGRVLVFKLAASSVSVKSISPFVRNRSLATENSLGT